MTITKELLLAKRDALVGGVNTLQQLLARANQEIQQAQANLNAHQGAIQQLDQLLAEFPADNVVPLPATEAPTVEAPPVISEAGA